MSLTKALTTLRKMNSGPRHPAYMMYSDLIRDEIVRVRPSTLDDLYKIKGVRKDFVLKYGNTVLDLIRTNKED